MPNKATTLSPASWHPTADRLTALGTRLLERRRELELSQETLACRVGFRRERLSRIENSRTLPTLHEICALAWELGVSLDHLLLGSPVPSPPAPAREMEWIFPPLAEISHLGSPEDLALLNRFLHVLALGLRCQGSPCETPSLSAITADLRAQP